MKKHQVHRKHLPEIMAVSAQLWPPLQNAYKGSHNGDL